MFIRDHLGTLGGGGVRPGRYASGVRSDCRVPYRGGCPRGQELHKLRVIDPNSDQIADSIRPIIVKVNRRRCSPADGSRSDPCGPGEAVWRPPEGGKSQVQPLAGVLPPAIAVAPARRPRSWAKRFGVRRCLGARPLCLTTRAPEGCWARALRGPPGSASSGWPAGSAPLPAGVAHGLTARNFRWYGGQSLLQAAREAIYSLHMSH